LVLFVDRYGEALLPQLTADDIMAPHKQYLPLQKPAPSFHIVKGCPCHGGGVMSVDSQQGQCSTQTKV